MIVLYFNLFGSIVFLLPALRGWVTPEPAALFWLFSTAVTGMVSQLSIIQACKVADISAVAPMDYSRLLFSSVLGFMLFAELPDGWSALGALVIVASTLYIAQREMKLARRARAGPRQRDNR